MRKPIAVLGSGPSGLLAAFAVFLSGRKIVIISNGGQSQIGGAQYLHRSIPFVTSEEPDAELTYRVVGDSYNYAKKAYGPSLVEKPPFLSFDHVQDGLTVPAWNLRGTYLRLWGLMQSHIVYGRVSNSSLMEDLKDFDLVISSIPRRHICSKPDAHSFVRRGILIYPECPLNDKSDNTIWYDGTPDHSWYRASRIFGTGSMEWGEGVKPPFPSLVRVAKPVSTTCDCWDDSEKVILVGRYGKWKKGELTHHAYEVASDELRKRGILE